MAKSKQPSKRKPRQRARYVDLDVNHFVTWVIAFITDGELQIDEKDMVNLLNRIAPEVNALRLGDNSATLAEVLRRVLVERAGVAADAKMPDIELFIDAYIEDTDATGRPS